MCSIYLYRLFVVIRTFSITTNRFLFHRRLRTRAGVSADWVAWCVHNYLPLHATLPLLPIQAVVGEGGGCRGCVDGYTLRFIQCTVLFLPAHTINKQFLDVLGRDRNLVITLNKINFLYQIYKNF